MGDYNGWRNRATWGVSLILNNDEGYYYTVLDWVKEYAESGMTRDDAKFALATAISEMVDEEYDEVYDRIDSPMMRQLLDAPSMMDIDYYEIAEGFIQGYEYDDPDNTWAKASQCKKGSAKPRGAKRNTSKAKAGKSKTSSSNARPKAGTPGKAPAKRTTAKKPARATSRRY